jgi:hypothetical protein
VSQQWYLLDAAVSVGMSYAYARKIVHAYNKEGLGAIVNRRRGRIVNSRALLNETQQQELGQALQLLPADGGVKTIAVGDSQTRIPLFTVSIHFP